MLLTLADCKLTTVLPRPVAKYRPLTRSHTLPVKHNRRRAAPIFRSTRNCLRHMLTSAIDTAICQRVYYPNSKGMPAGMSGIRARIQHHYSYRTPPRYVQNCETFPEPSLGSKRTIHIPDEGE